jgi:signal transduction histidine kinase
VSRRPQAVPRLLADAAALAEPLASAKSVELRIEAGPVAEAGVPCDADRILQVLTNLLGNAIRFAPSGGHVGLSAAREGPGGERVRFAVSDDGPGIEPAQMPHLFEPFAPMRGSREGLGVGLSIARSLVEAHEGRIWAESQPGRGSTFFFTLPAA